MFEVLEVLLALDDPPSHYGLTTDDLDDIAELYSWYDRWTMANDSGTVSYETLAEMVAAEPAWFLADISRHFDDDYYLDLGEWVPQDEDEDDE
jgi:hypothetical protein